MKIEITQEEAGGRTSLKVDGVELAGGASSFHLMKRAGEIPTLTVEMPIVGELNITLPDGIVVVEKPQAEE